MFWGAWFCVSMHGCCLGLIARWDECVRSDTLVYTRGMTTSDPLTRADFKRLANAMSKHLRDSRGGGIVERFEAVSKLIFTKIADERMTRGDWPGIPARPTTFSSSSTVSSRTLYERVRGTWNDATGGEKSRVLRSAGAFPTDVEGVARCVRLLAGYQLDQAGVDVKGAVYEELLRNTFEKNENQQYFTPQRVVEFAVQMANPSAGARVCDPACGSGGFLVGAMAHAASQADHAGRIDVVGADIDERMAWVARINVFLHGGDTAAVHCIRGAGALRPLAQIQHELPRGSFTHILANPPFGSDMTDLEGLKSLRTGKGRLTRRRGVLFIERCLELLQPNGRLVVVIDDSILNLASNEDIRQIMREQAVVEAVISLPEVTFMPYSTAKSSIVVLKRRDRNTVQGPVFMADVEQVGTRPNGDPLYREGVGADGERVIWSELPEVARAWHYFEQTGELPENEFEATIFLADLQEYAAALTDRLDVNFHHPTRARAAKLLARSRWDVEPLAELIDFPREAVKPENAFGDAPTSWIGLADIEKETGVYTPLEIPASRVKSACHPYQPGDLLFSRLRPKLRKTVLIEEGSQPGICSGELVVLRPKPKSKVLSAYVAYMLRSDLVYGQMVSQVTGVGRPRVGVPAVRKIKIPVPPLPEQWKIINALDEASARYGETVRQASEMISLGESELKESYSSAVESLLSGCTNISLSEVNSGSVDVAR